MSRSGCRSPALVHPLLLTGSPRVARHLLCSRSCPFMSVFLNKPAGSIPRFSVDLPSQVYCRLYDVCSTLNIGGSITCVNESVVDILVSPFYSLVLQPYVPAILTPTGARSQYDNIGLLCKTKAAHRNRSAYTRCVFSKTSWTIVSNQCLIPTRKGSFRIRRATSRASVTGTGI